MWGGLPPAVKRPPVTLVDYALGLSAYFSPLCPEMWPDEQLPAPTLSNLDIRLKGKTGSVHVKLQAACR